MKLKKILSVLLALIIGFTMTTSTAYAFSYGYYSLSSFDSVGIAINPETHTVTISGNGMFIPKGFVEGQENEIVVKTWDFHPTPEMSDFTKLVVEEGVTLIGNNAFEPLSSLNEITIPKSVKRICKDSFKNCSGIKTINYGGTEKEWERILIEDDVISNTKAKFNYSVKIEKSLIYADLKVDEEQTRAIDNMNYEFNYLTGKIKVDGKGKIGNYSSSENISNEFMVLMYCSHLDVDWDYFPSDWTPKDYVRSISLSTGITELGKNAFSLEYLKEVTIPKTVTKIDKNCFAKCSKLTDVYYYGTANDFKKIKIADGNDYLKKANVHYLPAPSTVKNLKMSANAPKSITLSWSKSSNASYYTIDKYNASEKKWIRVATTPKTSCKVAATEGCKYKFRVRAYRNVNDGNTLYSAYAYLEAASKPKGTSVKSLSAGKGKLTVKWSKQAERTTGYQIEYSTSKEFKKSTKINISNPNTTSRTIKGLKSGKRYYVRVRTYKTVKLNGKSQNIYSYWGTAKSVKVK